jgi:hypothetical protein
MNYYEINRKLANMYVINHLVSLFQKMIVIVYHYILYIYCMFVDCMFGSHLDFSYKGIRLFFSNFQLNS